MTALGVQPEPGDDLTARLKTLRNRTGESVNDQGRGHRPASDLAPVDALGSATQPPAEPWVNAGSRSPEEKVAVQASPPSDSVPASASQTQSRYQFVEGVSGDDDEAIDELLEGLGDGDFDLADDGDDGGVDLLPDCDPGAESKKAADLLESLRTNPGSSKGIDTPDDDDDSIGEQMSRAVEAILSQLQDGENSLLPPRAAEEDSETPHTGGAKEIGPADIEGARSTSDEGNTAPALPTVPTRLVDPVPDGAEADEDFENEISNRLAALRGFRSGSTVDAFGLPSAPTFRPQDRHTSPGSKQPGSTKYTDEDQKTWCVVCLEDATIRCIGCDNDVYCARCWREMHIGPSAGYDERGHQWAKFDRYSRV